MAEWVVCPHCQLRHTRRADDRCPRCKESADGPSPAEAAPAEAAAAESEAVEGARRAPEAPARPVPDRPAPDRPAVFAVPARPAPQRGTALPDVFDEAAFERVRQERQAAESDVPAVPLIARIGGAILTANGIVHLSLWTLEAASRSTLSVVGSWTAAFDLVVGAVLLSGQGQVYRWTLVRLLLGGLLVAGLHLLAGQLFALVLTTLFCGSMLVAMRSEHRPLLGAAATALALAAVGAGLLEQAPFLGSRNPMGHVSAAMNGRIEWEASAKLAGRLIPFELPLPAATWYRAKPTEEEREQIRKLTKPGSGNRPASELSASALRPDILAELQVLAFQAPPRASFDGEELVSLLVDEQRVRMAGLVILDDSWLDTPQGRVRVLEGITRMGGRRMGVALGVTVQGSCVLLVVGSVPQRNLPALRAEMAQLYPALHATGCEPVTGPPPPTFTPGVLARRARPRSENFSDEPPADDSAP